MESHQAIPSLMFMTLAAVLVIVAVALVYFLRKRSNRKPLENKREVNVAKEIDEGRRG